VAGDSGKPGGRGSRRAETAHPGSPGGSPSRDAEVPAHTHGSSSAGFLSRNAEYFSRWRPPLVQGQKRAEEKRFAALKGPVRSAQGNALG
jgi:hypothetical protein